MKIYNYESIIMHWVIQVY